MAVPSYYTLGFETGACLASYRMTDVAVSKAKRWRRWFSSMQTRSSSTKYVTCAMKNQALAGNLNLSKAAIGEDAEADTDNTDSTPKTE